jgi:hypothetical protein
MTDTMDERSIRQFVADTFSGVNVVFGTGEVAAGDTFFIYDPARDLEPKRQFPFATIVTKDYGDFDCASNLNRPDVFRLNIGVSRATFRSLFGAESPDRDFTELNRLLPHPVYAPQSWVCVLNPSLETFETLRPLLAEAYGVAVKRHAAKGPRDEA